MNMFKIAVVEDEKIYIDQMKLFLDKYQTERSVKLDISFFQDGEDITEKYGGFDIIFMDIQMRFMDGMIAARKIRELNQEVIIIFITNMIQYVIHGYQVDVRLWAGRRNSGVGSSRQIDRVGAVMVSNGT